MTTEQNHISESECHIDNNDIVMILSCSNSMSQATQNQPNWYYRLPNYNDSVCFVKDIKFVFWN